MAENESPGATPPAGRAAVDPYTQIDMLHDVNALLLAVIDSAEDGGAHYTRLARIASEKVRDVIEALDDLASPPRVGMIPFRRAQAATQIFGVACHRDERKAVSLNKVFEAIRRGKFD